MAKTDWAAGNEVTATELNALGTEVNGKADTSHGTHYTGEEVQDLVAGQFNHANHTNITAAYDDTSGEIRLAGVASGGSASDPLQMLGNQVKLVYRSANARWEFSDGTVPTLTGRTASITWEGTNAQIPAQGTGDAEFKEGDTALIRTSSL